MLPRLQVPLPGVKVPLADLGLAFGPDPGPKAAPCGSTVPCPTGAVHVNEPATGGSALGK